MHGDSKGDHVIISVKYIQPASWHAAIQVAEQLAAKDSILCWHCIATVCAVKSSSAVF